MTAGAHIPDEEWGLLANAIAQPVRQMVAVEAVDSAQMAEVERRLMAAAGNRPLLRQTASPDTDAPETAWQRARQLTAGTGDADPLPLLLVRVDAPPPEDDGARQRLAKFWRGMNQLRENWHELPAQVVFLLSPAAYEHLNLNADHLKRWIGLKIRLWQGATDIGVQERPGRGALQHDDEGFLTGGTPIDLRDDIERARLATLERQFRQKLAAGAPPEALLRPYLFPLISGHLALGDLEAARRWRNQITHNWLMPPPDRLALSALDEQLEAAGRPATLDVFLSHNSKDKPAVRELAQALRERGIIVWLDEDELRPGLNWQTLIEGGIALSRSIAVLIGRDGLGPWENEEMQAALVHAVKDGRPVIPVLLPDAPAQPKLPAFLGLRTWVDLRPGLTEAGLDRLVWGITGTRPGTERGSAVAEPAVPPPAIGHGQGEESPAYADVARSVPSPPAPPPEEEGRGRSRYRDDYLRVGAPTDNPFDPWTPATPPRFVGRAKLLRALGLALDTGRSVSVVGDRRIGKSSLLLTWAEQARQRGREARLLSGENSEGLSCARFVAALLGGPPDERDQDPDHAADRIARWAEGAPAGLPPLILVDEADKALAHLPHRLFERLRGMLGRICLVLATSRELHEIHRDDGLTSPLMNRLELQRLGLLEPEAAEALIARGAGGLTAGDVALMREWAGRHPFHLALLGHYLWQARAEGDDVAEALAQFRDNAFARLAELWPSLPDRQQHKLREAVSMNRDAPDPALSRRGLLDQGKPFGRVLRQWLEETP